MTGKRRLSGRARSSGSAEGMRICAATSIRVHEGRWTRSYTGQLMSNTFRVTKTCTMTLKNPVLPHGHPTHLTR